MQTHQNPLRGLFRRLVVIAVFLIVLSPFVWCLLLTLQGYGEVNGTYAHLMPRQLHWENYLTVLTNSGFVGGVVNSTLISLLSVVINLIISVPAGFALARIKTPLTNAFVRVMMMFVFVPILLLAVPVRKMLISWGLGGSYLMVALPMTALVMTTMTFWKFYSQFPNEMDDCSTMLGMTPIHGFFCIYLPVSGKMALYAAIMQFVTTWNCSFMPLFMYRRIGNITTVQQSLLQYALSPSWIFVGMAAVLLACLPCWLLYELRSRIAGSVEDSVADPFRNSN